MTDWPIIHTGEAAFSRMSRAAQHAHLAHPRKMMLISAGVMLAAGGIYAADQWYEHRKVEALGASLGQGTKPDLLNILFGSFGSQSAIDVPASTPISGGQHVELNDIARQAFGFCKNAALGLIGF